MAISVFWQKLYLPKTLIWKEVFQTIAMLGVSFFPTEIWFNAIIPFQVHEMYYEYYLIHWSGDVDLLCNCNYTIPLEYLYEFKAQTFIKLQ